MNWLWTTEDMIAAMAGRPFGSLPQGITGISIDSRSIAPGEAFFAIKGDRVDGHDYASMAMANGASLLVVSEARLPAMGRLTVPMIVVEDVLAALGKLGLASRERRGPRSSPSPVRSAKRRQRRCCAMCSLPPARSTHPLRPSTITGACR